METHILALIHANGYILGSRNNGDTLASKQYNRIQTWWFAGGSLLTRNRCVQHNTKSRQKPHCKKGRFETNKSKLSLTTVSEVTCSDMDGIGKDYPCIGTDGWVEKDDYESHWCTDGECKATDCCRRILSSIWFLFRSFFLVGKGSPPPPQLRIRSNGEMTAIIFRYHPDVLACPVDRTPKDDNLWFKSGEFLVRAAG